MVCVILALDLSVSNIDQADKIMLKCKILVVLSVFLLVALLFTDSALSQDPELIARWPMDENSGDLVRDVVGGHNGKFLGAGPKWAPARFESGLEFNGTVGAVVEIPRDPELQPADSMTLSAWIKVSDLYTGQRQNFVSYADSYVLFIEGNLGTIVEQNQANNSWFPCNADMVVAREEWYFMAMTFDSKDLSLYVNGELQKTVDAKAPEIPYKASPFWFGACPGRKNWWLQGSIDEVQLWNKAMTAAEIMSAYEKPLPSSAVSSKGKLPATWSSIKDSKSSSD